MADIFSAADVSVSLKGSCIAVLGYGNQGAAQAQNLRDRGYAVVVGNRDDCYRDEAIRAGFPVHSIAEAAREADVVVVCLPDEVQPQFRAVWDSLHAGQTAVFASGYNVFYDRFSINAASDVVLAAPRMLGAGVRSRVVEGRGFPMLVGVHQDPSGHGFQTALAYCQAVGALLPGGVAVASSFREEAILDLFSEHTWAGSLLFFLQACFEVLTEHGVSHEAAILELYASGELGAVGAAVADRGLFDQMRLHSTTSQYGQLTRGPGYVTADLTERLESVYRDLESGRFAEEWTREEDSGRLDELREKLSQSNLARAEDRLYRLLKRRGP